jgi:HK97 family phage major capsid protein
MTDQEIKDRDVLRAKETVEIFALARDYDVPQEAINKHVTEGGSLADFRGIVLRDFAGQKAKADAARAVEAAAVARKQTGISGTVPADKAAQFSLLRAMRGHAKRMNPALDIQAEDDGLEREICTETVRLIRQNPEGKNYVPRGLPIPWDLVRGNAVSREFNIAGTGSNVVAQNLRPELFIDYLRAKLILAKLGITTLTGLVGDVLIPKQTATAAAGWVDETTAGTAGTMTVGQIKVTPHTLGAYTDISRQLLLQSTPSADMLVMNDLTESLARSIQLAGFHGTGANNQPTGLAVMLASGIVAQGIAAVTEATVSSDGNPTYAEIEAMLAGVEEANIDGEFKWALRPTAFRKLKGVGRVGTTGAIPIAIEEKGVKYLADSVAETTSALTTKYAFAGRWDSMVMAMWGALDLTLDPYSLSTRGALRVVALQSVDFGYRYGPAWGWSSKFAAS